MQSEEWEVFPPEFDPEFYLQNSTVASEREEITNEIGLLKHFTVFGREEGRPGSKGVFREEIRKLIAGFSPALEIGPFVTPFLDCHKASFFNVLSTEDMRQKASSLMNGTTTAIPYIDYVSSRGDLSIIDAQFKLVFSSHLIEYQTDLVEHLQQVGRILELNGIYVAIISDYRYCFNHFLSHSSIGEVLEAYICKSGKARLRHVIEHWALGTHNDAFRHWNKDHGDTGILTENVLKRIKICLDEWQDGCNDACYMDVHSWRFHPEICRLVLQTLYDLEFSTLLPIRVYNTPRNRGEFITVLLNTKKENRLSSRHSKERDLEI